jgi:outer membrane protein
MSRRPLFLALALILPASLAGNASAADLMQTYELARAGDPQLASAESGRLAQKEGEWAPFDRSGWRSLVYPDPNR